MATPLPNTHPPGSINERQIARRWQSIGAEAFTSLAYEELPPRHVYGTHRRLAVVLPRPRLAPISITQSDVWQDHTPEMVHLANHKKVFSNVKTTLSPTSIPAPAPLDTMAALNQDGHAGKNTTSVPQAYLAARQSPTKATHLPEVASSEYPLERQSATQTPIAYMYPEPYSPIPTPETRLYSIRHPHLHTIAYHLPTGSRDTQGRFGVPNPNIPYVE